jgi:hypothetical protein
LADTGPSQKEKDRFENRAQGVPDQKVAKKSEYSKGRADPKALLRYVIEIRFVANPRPDKCLKAILAARNRIAQSEALHVVVTMLLEKSADLNLGFVLEID